MKRLILLYFFLAAIFLSHYAIAGQAVYGDGIDYWAYLHSVYFDHDIDFENEYRHLYSSEYNNHHPEVQAADIQKTFRTPIGKTDNPHLPGTALLLMPFYILADGIVRLELPVLRNGYSDIYQIVCGLGAVLYVVLATSFVEKICFFYSNDRRLSILAALAILLASPLLYYGSYDIINSHFASYFLVSLFWYLLLLQPQKLLLIGVVMGGATLVRIHEALLVLPLVTQKRKLSELSIILVVFGITILPLWVIWEYLYRLPYPYYYATMGHIYRGIWGSLFHPTNGLFSRTPLLLLALLPLKNRQTRKLLAPMLVYLALSFILITYQGGWMDPAYGGRMYISNFPLFAILLTGLLKFIREKYSMRYVYNLVGFFFVLNALSIGSFVLFEKEVNSGQRRGLEEQTLQRLQQKIPFLQ